MKKYGNSTKQAAPSAKKQGAPNSAKPAAKKLVPKKV
jgi:hypothetical protein